MTSEHNRFRELEDGLSAPPHQSPLLAGGDSSIGVAFELPRGYRDPAGCLHRRGVMRPATARDEMRALSDFRVHLDPAAYLSVVLSRTVERLGDLKVVRVGVIEQLDDVDRDELERVYRMLNGYVDDERIGHGTNRVEAAGAGE